jgi:hypothetical protein
VGVSVIPPIAVIPAGMPGAADVIVIDEHAKAYRAANPAMKRAFEEAARAHNVLAEWREEDAGSSTVARVVMRHARTADLVAALQTASDWKGSRELDIAELLALESGRPVLIKTRDRIIQTPSASSSASPTGARQLTPSLCFGVSTR